MADVVNTTAVNPLLPKPDKFVTIGSAQGTANLNALGMAETESAQEQAGLRESATALVNERTKLTQKQQDLQAKQAEAVRLQGEVTTKEGQVTSLQSALTAAQQDLENRRKAAEEAARQRQAEVQRQVTTPPPQQQIYSEFSNPLTGDPRINEARNYQAQLNREYLAMTSEANNSAATPAQREAARRELEMIDARRQASFQQFGQLG